MRSSPSWSVPTNDAKILGLLYELSRYCIRKQLMQETFEHNAVQVGHRLLVDSFSAAHFVTGANEDTRFSFMAPCPPTIGATGRLATYNTLGAAILPADGGPRAALDELDRFPAEATAANVSLGP